MQTNLLLLHRFLFFAIVINLLYNYIHILFYNLSLKFIDALFSLNKIKYFIHS